MTMQVHQVYLSLGSNLGNRQQNLSRAITLITNRIGLIKDQSDLFVTEPVGFTSAHLFINMVVRLETTLTAIQVLKTTQQIEKELVSVLKHIGFHKSIIHKKEVQQNIKDIAKKIYEYQQKMNRESRTIWKEEIYQESKDHGVSST